MNPQLNKLETLISMAERCRPAASVGHLFASRAGAALMNALHDLTGIEAVYDAAQDCAREAGIGFEPPASAATNVSRTINDMNWSRSAS